MTLYDALGVYVTDKFNDSILICSKQGHKTGLKSWQAAGESRQNERKREREELEREREG